MRRVVASFGGQEWVVRRRWAPRLGQDSLFGRFRRRVKRMRKRAEGWADGIDVLPDGCVDLDDLLIGVAVIVAVIVLVLFVIPLLVSLIDLVIVLILALLSVVARIVFRRPWIIEARADDGTVRTWKVVGWRASRDRRDEIAQLLSAGVAPPDEISATR